MSNMPSVIKNLKLRITNLENYNSGLATESCEQQAKIAELEKENKQLEDCFDECYAELGKIQHELNKALKDQE
jgi:FtsZ-binding cell division protein ZapB